MATETDFEKKQREQREFQSQQAEFAKQYDDKTKEALKHFEKQQEELKKTGAKFTPEQVQQNLESIQHTSPEMRQIAQAHGKFVGMSEPERQQFLRDSFGPDQGKAAPAAPSGNSPNGPKGPDEKNRNLDSPVAPGGNAPNNPNGPDDGRDPEALLNYYTATKDLKFDSDKRRGQQDVEAARTTNPYSDMAQSAYERDVTYLKNDQRRAEQIEAETDPVKQERLKMIREIETSQHSMEVSNAAANICGMTGNDKDQAKCLAEYEGHENRRNEMLQKLADFDGPDGPGGGSPNGPDKGPNNQDPNQGQTPRDGKSSQDKGSDQGKNFVVQRIEEMHGTANGRQPKRNENAVDPELRQYAERAHQQNRESEHSREREIERERENSRSR